MSRVGKKAVAIPSGVLVSVSGQDVSVAGKLGKLSLSLAAVIEAKVADGQVQVSPREESRVARSLWGLSRSLVNNMVQGVTKGYSISLELEGVGYRAQADQKTLTLQLGFSHDVKVPIPPGIAIKCERPTLITITGIDKREVGQCAAEIRAFKRPEPYKGKGIRYQGERVRRKEGKKK